VEADQVRERATASTASTARSISSQEFAAQIVYGEILDSKGVHAVDA